MKTDAAPSAKYLKDYAPYPDWLVRHIDLTFQIFDAENAGHGRQPPTGNAQRRDG